MMNKQQIRRFAHSNMIAMQWCAWGAGRTGPALGSDSRSTRRAQRMASAASMNDTVCGSKPAPPQAPVNPKNSNMSTVIGLFAAKTRQTFGRSKKMAGPRGSVRCY